MKPTAFLGSALEDLRAFPEDAKREAGFQKAGFQLDKVQRGMQPDDFKPMKTVGAGVYEIRIRTRGQAHRVFYVARFEEAVYVLHAFEKKTQRTPKRDIETGRRRYRELIRWRKER